MRRFQKNICFLLLFCLFLSAAALPPDGAFDWNSAAELFPGIRHVFQECVKPRLMKINAVRIDLTTPDLAFCTTPRDPDWGKPMPDFPSLTVRTRRQTTRDFMKERPEVVLAVNASPWSPWEMPFSHRYADRMGAVVSGGVLVSLPDGRPAFLVKKDGSKQIRAVGAKENLADADLAVGGFYLVLERGKVLARGSGLAPRTGYGLSGDGRYLYWITIDGRQKGYSLGATPGEVGRFLKYYGADVGINMDGGGSTTLMRRGADGRPVRLNHADGERRNGNHLGIYYRKTKTGKQ